MLCIVPTIVDEIRRYSSELCATWLRKLGVVRNEAHAGTDFVGPQCKTILAEIDALREMTSPAAREHFLDSRDATTPQQRRDAATEPPDPHEQKSSVPESDHVVREVRILQCCSALENFHNIIA